MNCYFLRNFRTFPLPTPASKKYWYIPVPYMGRDSSVGIGNCYRLNGTGIVSRWEARFFAPVQTDPEAHTASYTKGTGSFLGVKRPGRDVDHPLPSSAEVKEIRAVRLLRFWAFVACSKVSLTFTFTSTVSV
jgi:hypothetical protein